MKRKRMRSSVVINNNCIVATVGALFVIAIALSCWAFRMGGWQSSRYSLSSSVGFYDLEAKDIYGKLRRMEEWKGKALLVTNVASK